MLHVLQHFIPELAAGFLVNLEIAAAVVLIALLVGVPVALLRHGLAPTRRPIAACVRLMQAMPTYVVMFFMLTLVPHGLSLFGWPVTGIIAVILAQSVYLTAYVVEDATEALRHLEQNNREHAMLFLPNLLRGFIVVVMSSGFGAAVGVSEAVSATMRQAESLPPMPQRLVVFAVAVTFFAVVIGLLNMLIRMMIRGLSRSFVPVKATG